VIERFDYRLTVIRFQIMGWVAIRQMLHRDNDEKNSIHLAHPIWLQGQQKKEIMMNLNFAKSLLTSRKFWLAFLAVLGAVVMFGQGAITAEQLVESIVVLAGLVIGGIALEDAAQKYNPPTEISLLADFEE